MDYILNTGCGLGHIHCAHCGNNGVIFVMVFMRSILCVVRDIFKLDCFVFYIANMFNRNMILHPFKSE